MGNPVLLMGDSGSGKTYSIKTLDPDKVGVFLVEKPRLPFRKEFRCKKNATYMDILSALANPKQPIYVIDDSQYLLVNEFFDRASEPGYQKYTDLALNFRNLIHFVINKAPDNVIVYFLHHTETDNNGKVKAKTVGKMLDEKLTVEGLFDIVLRTEIDSEGHWLRTQSNGQDTVKSPEDMFPIRIPNDLALVDRMIRDYYGMEPITNTKKSEEK